jgi:hypothetical protein
MFIPRARPDRPDWSHENMSLDLLDLLLDENGIDILDGDPEGRGDYKYGRHMVQQMVMGGKGNPHMDVAKGLFTMEEKPFLFEIIANSRCGIDCDRLDYVRRDTYNIGLQCSVDHKRLIYSARVVGGYIAHHAKEYLSVYELFHTRYMLFKQIYVHRATKAIDLMITDVMLEANAAWGGALAAAIDNPKEYMLQTDCLLREIERSSDPSLSQAQAILLNLRRRKLYRFVDEYLVPVDKYDTLKKITSFDIASSNPDPSFDISPDTVVVHDTKFNYGKGKENPVDHCIFFRDSSDDTGFKIRSDRVSHMLPQVFEERVIRVYTKDSDPGVVAAVQRAFRRLLKTHLGNVSMEPDPSSKVFVGHNPEMPVEERLDSCASGTRPHASDHFDYDDQQGTLSFSQAQRTRLHHTAPPVAVHGSAGIYSPVRNQSSAIVKTHSIAATVVDDDEEAAATPTIFQLPSDTSLDATLPVSLPSSQPVAGTKRSITAFFSRSTGEDAKRQRSAPA